MNRAHLNANYKLKSHSLQSTVVVRDFRIENLESHVKYSYAALFPFTSTFRPTFALALEQIQHEPKFQTDAFINLIYCLLLSDSHISRSDAHRRGKQTQSHKTLSDYRVILAHHNLRYYKSLLDTRKSAVGDKVQFARKE